MIKWIAQMLGGIIVGPVVDIYKAKIAAGTDADKLATDLAIREIALQQKEMELRTEYKKELIGKWYAVENLFGYTLWFWFFKVVVWDKALGNWTGGTTDPITGVAAQWAGYIIAFYFGKRALDSFGSIVATVFKR